MNARVEKEQQYAIYPFIHSFSNIKSDERQLTPVMVPDILPANLPSTVDFSMVAGDFTEVYNQSDNRHAWDVVVTCFFMDTAKNIIEYMETIHHALKQHGTWINVGMFLGGSTMKKWATFNKITLLGPLLYHFEDSSSGEPSIELSLEQLKDVARKIGFEIKASINRNVFFNFIEVD